MNGAMQILSKMLEKSQFSSQESIKQKQHEHLEKIIQYAKKNVKLYEDLYADLDTFDINLLPMLTRNKIQSAGAEIISRNLPKEHGKVYPMKTSGSTGKAIEVLATDFTRLFYDALMLRFHDWHQHDFLKTIMAIRWPNTGSHVSDVSFNADWGWPINQYVSSGHSVLVNIALDTLSQIEAMMRYKPYHLHSYPSQLAALAEYSLAHDIQLPRVEYLSSTGETFCEAYKEKIRAAWPEAKLADIYSAEEVGSIAFQCPYHDHYHVNAEHVYVEVVDQDGRACQLGEVGRVLITSLLNYATPLIRYDIGDYAEAGAPCASGINLPVIHKISGRKRNRLRLPTGESRFPYLGDRKDFLKITKGKTSRQFQMIQHSLYDIEVKLAIDEHYSVLQEKQFKELLQKNLGYPFNILITYLDHIPLGPRGKFEEFMSNL